MFPLDAPWPPETTSWLGLMHLEGKGVAQDLARVAHDLVEAGKAWLAEVARVLRGKGDSEEAERAEAGGSPEGPKRLYGRRRGRLRYASEARA